ncbi:MAG: hypothetical protein K2N15_03225 [Lachnospiraceae bacterium]|nr:hypothetical protein [Lachnospiraceae bacterium]
MSRIDAGECEHMDMEWYGVDRQGNIAVFCSGGEGNLPEFVCESEERADELIEYFDKIEKNTSSILIFSQTQIGHAEQIARDFSDKGLYYFDADDGTKLGVCSFREYYTKHSYPQKPLKYGLLPKHIREILKHNFMEIEDFSLVDTIYVKHAYK